MTNPPQYPSPEWHELHERLERIRSTTFAVVGTLSVPQQRLTELVVAALAAEMPAIRAQSAGLSLDVVAQPATVQAGKRVTYAVTIGNASSTPLTGATLRYTLPSGFDLVPGSTRVRANGVSLLHGQVSRGMFSGLWSGFDNEDVPITSITNGVHAPTWVAREVIDLAHGESIDDAPGWEAIANTPDDPKLLQALVDREPQRARAGTRTEHRFEEVLRRVVQGQPGGVDGGVGDGHRDGRHRPVERDVA